MKTLDERVTEFSQAVRRIIEQFQRLNSQKGQSPHVELSQQEIRLIEHLRLAGFQKMKAISEYLGVAVNSVTSIVDQLERKEYVTRQRSQDDRRVVFVHLTVAGSSVADASMSAKRRLMRSLLEVLPEDEQELLVTMFWKIASSRLPNPDAQALEC